MELPGTKFIAYCHADGSVEFLSINQIESVLLAKEGEGVTVRMVSGRTIELKPDGDVSTREILLETINDNTIEYNE